MLQFIDSEGIYLEIHKSQGLPEIQ